MISGTVVSTPVPVLESSLLWQEINQERERRQLAEERGESGTSDFEDPTILSTLSTWWSTLTTLPTNEKLNSMKRIDILGTF